MILWWLSFCENNRAIKWFYFVVVAYIKVIRIDYSIISNSNIHQILYNQINYSRRVWRYQRGIHNLYIEEEQTTQWPKEKVQKDKQRAIKHTHKTKDQVTN
jgi:hypothetical protein